MSPIVVATLVTAWWVVSTATLTTLWALEVRENRRLRMELVGAGSSRRRSEREINRLRADRDFYRHGYYTHQEGDHS